MLTQVFHSVQSSNTLLLNSQHQHNLLVSTIQSFSETVSSQIASSLSFIEETITAKLLSVVAPLDAKLDTLKAEIDAIKGEKAQGQGEAGGSGVNVDVGSAEEKLVKLFSKHSAKLQEKASYLVNHYNDKMTEVMDATDKLVKYAMNKSTENEPDEPTQVWISSVPVVPRAQVDTIVNDLQDKFNDLFVSTSQSQLDAEELRIKLNLIFKANPTMPNLLEKDIKDLVSENLEKNGDSDDTRAMVEFLTKKKLTLEKIAEIEAMDKGDESDKVEEVDGEAVQKDKAEEPAGILLELQLLQKKSRST